MKLLISGVMVCAVLMWGKALADAPADCHAVISPSGITSSGDGQTTITFDVSVDVPNSAGSYSYTYDERGPDGATTNRQRSGFSWAAASGDHFQITDDLSVPSDEVSNVQVDATAVKCTPTP